jgi:ABC-type multidrug transport system fused ATPase/permease subunit
VGTFVLVQAYIISINNSLWSFSRIVRDMTEGISDAKEMVEMLHLPHEIQDIPNATALNVPKGLIEFKNVSFSFGENKPVFNKLNLSIKAGEKVALIGSSGAGKSTLVKLLLRLNDIQGGEISIDGQNIKNVTQESLRENISLVPQDPALFHRTLMENIRYGRRDATDEEVINSSKLAHCDIFIKEFPYKYETFVGERGIKLSGGERQRVAIARALLKNAPILVLDEATSSLDSHSESLIQDALQTLMKGKTTLVIAHRLSTIRKMDRIIVLGKDGILEEGSHEQLIQKHGMSARLWNLQAGGFADKSIEELLES